MCLKTEALVSAVLGDGNGAEILSAYMRIYRARILWKAVPLASLV